MGLLLDGRGQTRLASTAFGDRGRTSGRGAPIQPATGGRPTAFRTRPWKMPGSRPDAPDGRRGHRHRGHGKGASTWRTISPATRRVTGAQLLDVGRIRWNSISPAVTRPSRRAARSGSAAPARARPRFIDLTAPAVTRDHPERRPGRRRARSTATGSRWTASRPTNELRVVAECAYSRSGEGLHRFTDPVGRRHLPVLRPGNVRRPPRLRLLRPARPEGDLRVHRDRSRRTGRWSRTWRRRAASQCRRRGRGTRWHFPPSPLMSTYITAVVAGPYHAGARPSTTASRSASTAASRWPSTWTRTRSSR